MIDRRAAPVAVAPAATPLVRPRRPRAARAGRSEPARQRRQVHAARRHHPSSPSSDGHGRDPRHRHRRRPRAELLPNVFDLFVQGERPLDRTRRRARHRAHARAAAGRAARRPRRGPQRRPRQGSEFVVRLPVDGRRRADEGRRHDGAPAASRPHAQVLVVEDHQDAARGARHDARDLGPRGARRARRRRRARRASTWRPTSSSPTSGLPRIDGYELARRLRAPALRWRARP